MLAAVLAHSLLALSSRADGDGEAEKQLFNSLYAKPLQRVQQTSSRDDNLELARNLLKECEKVASQPGLMIHFLDAAYGLSFRVPTGYDVALEAAERIDAGFEARRADARKMQIDLLGRLVRSARGDERGPWVDKLVAVYVGIGQDEMKANDYAAASRTFRTAQTLAFRYKHPAAVTFKAMSTFAVQQLKVSQQLTKLEEDLLRDANDIDVARKLVELYLLEREDAASASRIASRTNDAALISIAKLSGSKLSKLDGSQTMALATWYFDQRKNVSESAKDIAYQRAKFYLTHFLESTSASGVMKAKAILMFKEVESVLDERELRVVAKLIESVDEPMPTRVPPRLTIIEAIYGVGNRKRDVTEKLSSLIKDNYLATDVWGYLGDPARGTTKWLTVRYKIGDEEVTIKRWDGQWLFLVPDQIDVTPPSDGLHIVEAKYGAHGRFADATEALRKRVSDNTMAAGANNRLLGRDPARDCIKRLWAVYFWQGKVMVKSAGENGTLRLP